MLKFKIMLESIGYDRTGYYNVYEKILFFWCLKASFTDQYSAEHYIYELKKTRRKKKNRDKPELIGYY